MNQVPCLHKYLANDMRVFDCLILDYNSTEKAEVSYLIHNLFLLFLKNTSGCETLLNRVSQMPEYLSKAKGEDENGKCIRVCACFHEGTE